MQAYGARVLRWVNDADTATGKHDVQALAPLKRARWVNLPSQDPLHPGPALKNKRFNPQIGSGGRGGRLPSPA